MSKEGRTIGAHTDEAALDEVEDIGDQRTGEWFQEPCDHKPEVRKCQECYPIRCEHGVATTMRCEACANCPKCDEYSVPVGHIAKCLCGWERNPDDEYLWYDREGKLIEMHYE